MYVWLRFGRLMATAPFKKKVGLLDDTVCKFRVGPQDIDPYMHRNNGRYLTIMDIGRMELLARNGVWQACRQAGCKPMMVASTMRFKRPLSTFQGFIQRSRVIVWDETRLYIDQTFERQGALMTRCLAAMVVLDTAKGRRVPIAGIAAALGHDGPSPELPPEVLFWGKWVSSAGHIEAFA